MKKNYSFRLYKLFIFLTVFILLPVLCFSQSSNLPLLDLNKYRFDFGATDYMISNCQNLVLKNIGDTTLNIYHIDSLKSPFSGNIVFPDTLKKGDSIVFKICYTPKKISTADSQRVFLRADTRLSHSIVLLFDVSTSMDSSMKDGTKKIIGAKNAGTRFINSMLATPKVWDEAAIMSFSATPTTNQDFTTNKNLLINSLPTVLSGYTAIFDACIYAINKLKVRQFSKVLVLLTDGNDNSSVAKEQDVIQQAKANKILIYTVGLGSNVNDLSLNTIATSTGGLYFKAQTSKELNDIYDRIFAMLSKNVELYFDVLGKCTGPFSEMSCKGNGGVYLNPGDTISYNIYINQISNKIAFKDAYKLKFSFEKNILFPIGDSNITYNNDGILYVNGFNTVDLDSLPLTNIVFRAMLGDTTCTDVTLESVTWQSGKVQSLLSNHSCKVCLKTCNAGGTRLFKSDSNSLIFINKPNPFNNTSELSFATIEPGYYKLIIYDELGREIKKLVDGELNPGQHYFYLDAGDFAGGNYYCELYTPSQILSRLISVYK